MGHRVNEKWADSNGESFDLNIVCIFSKENITTYEYEINHFQPDL